MNRLQILYWLPRGIAIITILFLGVFALDVFDGKASTGKMIIGFLIHLVPNYILTVLLFIAWKNEMFGGILFILTALLMWFFFANPFIVNLFLFGPILLTGLLFLIHGYMSPKTLEY